MHKAELIDYIAKEYKCTKVEAENIINTFTGSITDVLGKGEDVVLMGFGKFYSSKVEARSGRNPKTGESMQIPAYTQPKFSAGSGLKAACNAAKSANAKGSKKK